MTSYPAGAGIREGGFAGGFPPEVPEVPSKEEVAILIMLKKEFTGLTASQLARFLRKLYPELSKKQRQKKVHRILNKLEEKGFVKTEKIGNFRFARITLEGVLFLAKVADKIDLNLRLGCPKHPKSLLRLLPQRSHDAWYQIAVRLLTKPVEYFEEIDKELLGLSFSAWLDDISERVLLFLDERDGGIIKKPYKTRFTHPGCVKYLLAKYEEAWEIATGGYEEGVFLTITLPPIFPLKIEQYLLSYMRHRLRNWLRRRYKFTPPSIVSNEPQESLNYHNHIVFFGIGWIMEKRDLTEWLDDKVERFLSEMGRHIQKTINNRLTSEEVKEFNKYGRRLLKRYKRYKRRHRGYRGPVNWITKIYKEGDKWVFVNLPPDLQGNRRAGTLYDGGDVAVSDYLKKYLVKNLKVLKSGFADDDVRLAWYWLLRIPFYTVSPSLRVPRKKSPPVGLKFIGSYHASACEILSLGLLG